MAAEEERDSPQERRGIDPTANVQALVDAAMKRQDDLRERDAAHAREMRETARRYEDRLDAKDQQIRGAESARIDAIRAVDVGAVAAAAAVAEARANTLAGQVATTADAFRSALAAALDPIQKAIEDLRRAQYEAQGQKTQVVEARDTRNDARLSVGMLVGIAGVVLSIITIAVAIILSGHSAG